MPITQDRIDRLREFGLSDYAARAYLALLDLGVTEASEVSKLTKVPTSKIYHVLEQLHEKGLVEILPEFPKKYAPVPFVEFLDKLRRDAEDEARRLAVERDDLGQLFAVVGNVEVGDRGTFTIVRNRRNVMEKIGEMLERAEREVLVLGTRGMALRFTHLAATSRAALGRGARMRVVVPLEDAETRAAFAPLAGVAEVRARVVDASDPGASVAILVVDDREAFIVNYVPDDASSTSGKDVALYTDQRAMVAALAAIVAPAWRHAASYADVTAPAAVRAPRAAEAPPAFRRAFEEAASGMAVVDATGRFVEANRALVALAPVLAEAPDVALADVVLPEDREVVAARLADAFAGRSPPPVETRIGDVLVRVAFTPVEGADGSVAEAVVHFDDLTPSKSAEEDLKRTLSLLTATLESTADGILVVDPSGRVVSHNQRFREMWRLGESALVGERDVRHADEILGQVKDREAFLRKVEESDARPEAETFDVVECKDGRVFERSSQPQRIGRDVVGRVWCFRDVTGQRRVEHALRQAEVYYRGLVQSARAVFWRADPRTHDFTFVSREAENLLGYPVGRWLSEPGFWMERVHPEDRAWVVDFRRSATREKRAHEYEYRMVAEDGRVVWVRDIVRVAVKDDRAVEVVGVMIDITDRKEAEESLRDLAERLGEIVTTQRDIGRSGMPFEDLMALVAVRAHRLAKADAAYVGLDRDGVPTIAAACGTALDRVGQPLDAVSALVLRTGDAVRIDDAELDPRADPAAMRRADVRALAAVPLRRGHEVVGVLTVTSAHASMFGDRDADILDVLGGLLAAAFPSARRLQPDAPPASERKARARK